MSPRPGRANTVSTTTAPAEERPELEPDDGGHGDQRVPERVLSAPRRAPPCPLARAVATNSISQDLAEARADERRVIAALLKPERQRGQHDRARGSP